MTQSTPASLSPFAVFRNRSFSLLWTGQLVSTMGSALTSLAASIYIYRLTGFRPERGTDADGDRRAQSFSGTLRRCIRRSLRPQEDHDYGGHSARAIDIAHPDPRADQHPLAVRDRDAHQRHRTVL